MMTEAQRARLPEILRDIIAADEALASIRAGLAEKVLPFDLVRRARSKFQARREMSAAAEHLYGRRLTGNGPALA
jgi:hypothetical protein